MAIRARAFSTLIASAATAALLLAITACGPNDHGGTGDDDGTTTPKDVDHDGYDTTLDCNDNNPAVHPGATEMCNNTDDDCNGKVDETWDMDGDGHAMECGYDCDETDASVYVGAPEQLNGKDDDCDGIPDNHRQDTDDDMDGYTELQGDCDDTNKMINPGAVEVQTRMDGTPEGVDNDCNGLVDEPPQPCDQGLVAVNPMHMARAMDICKNLTAASMNDDADPVGFGIETSFGSAYTPKLGANMISLASGQAAAPVSGQYSFTTQNNGHPHPDPHGDPGDGCGKADPATVNDFTELDLELDVPVNAKSFSFDFNFMTQEYPEWVCTQYDDTFVAKLESTMFNGNISFDSMGRPVTVNVGFFTTCAVGSEPPGKPGMACTGDADLAGTGYDGGRGGGTGWLTTTAPVTPGEHIKLHFMIFDEGDHAYDSSVLIDNFRWLGDPVDGPVTIPRVTGPTVGLPDANETMSHGACDIA